MAFLYGREARLKALFGGFRPRQKLKQSPFLADCYQLDQSAANFAAIEVEFRAPSLAIADGLVEQHHQMVDMLAEPGCISFSRRLLDDEAGARADADQNRLLKEQLQRANAAIAAKNAAIAAKDAAIAAKDAAIKNLRAERD
jgi:hypothetical protein